LLLFLLIVRVRVSRGDGLRIIDSVKIGGNVCMICFGILICIHQPLTRRGLIISFDFPAYHSRCGVGQFSFSAMKIVS